MTLVIDDADTGAGGGDAPARVALRFEPSGTAVRVPPGVTVFDAASWNGIAIDSTCGGHGTCKKCKVQVVDGAVPASPLDARAFSEDELADGWRLACRSQADHDLVVHVPPLVTRPKAATVGVGRQVILHPALQKRYVELDEPSLADQRTDLQRIRDAIDDLELRVETGVLRRLPGVLRSSALQGHVRRRRRPPDRRRARRHDRRACTRSRSTWARPRSSRRCSTSAPARRWQSGRCSTSSSPSGPT